MALTANVFLLWMAFCGLLGKVDTSPGILAKFSNKGLQVGADVALKELNRRINEEVHLEDVSGSFSFFSGHADYFLTKLEVTRCRLEELTVSIIPGTGVRVSVGKILASIAGDFSYRSVLLYISSRNSGAFSITTSDASLSLDVTVGMSPDGLPTLAFPSCFASFENIDLTLEAKVANGLLNQFKGTMKDKIRPTLKDAACDAIEKARNLIEKEIAKHIQPCINGSCDFRIDLRLDSRPVFGDNFVQTTHRGKIFWGNDTDLVPFEALPFEPLTMSSKMADISISPYVLNTELYAMQKNGLLSYTFTKSDLPHECPTVLDISCSDNRSLCIGKMFPSIVVGISPDTSVELHFVTIRPPFVRISTGRMSVTFHVRADVSARKSDDRSTAVVGQLSLQGSAEMSVIINADALIDFTGIEVNMTNATFSDTKEEIDLFKNEDWDVIASLQAIARHCVLPKFFSSSQRSLSVTNIGPFHTQNRSLKLIPNAISFTSDGFDSGGI